MAKREAGEPALMGRAVEALERISLALGALVVNQSEATGMPARAKRLRELGFSNIDIARMLGSTPNAIGVALHKGRSKGARRRRARGSGRSAA